MENVNLNELKCIQVTKDGNVDMWLSFNQFKESFVDERWKNERRTKKEYTIFGHWHTRTTVKFDENKKSVRDFVFPESEAIARKLHENYIRENGVG